jgi:hypothetical protein
MRAPVEAASVARLPVHPIAELFPMMADAELNELAADIAANGLITPIALDHAGSILIDGRNRLEACERAGVVPRYTMLDADVDPAAYIVSANLKRRNLKKGQQAMALALIYPESEKGGRGKKGVANSAAKLGGFSRDRVDQARKIVGHSRELALAVLADVTPLDDALEQVKQAEKARQSVESKLERLRASAPDLADLVADERLGLDEAIAALDKRRAQEREQREATLRVVSNAIDAIAAFDSPTFCEAVEQLDVAELATRLGGEPDLAKLDRACGAFRAVMERLRS